MDDVELLCVTLLAHPDEPEATFKGRLTAFWSRLLRERPELYEQVYAEAVEFSEHQGRLGRQYMVEQPAVAELLQQLQAEGIAYAPVDWDDTYSRYEASGPEWFQIEH